MSDTIKNWLPITKRNRVALGFAVAALVMFVTWNLMPDYYEANNSCVAMVIWPELFSPDKYMNVFESPDIDGFRFVASAISVILNGLLILVIVPFWKILHASNYIKLPLVIFNLAGGLVLLWYAVESTINGKALSENFVLLLIILSLLALSAALFIFKNELGFQNDLEVKKMMGGDSW